MILDSSSPILLRILKNNVGAQDGRTETAKSKKVIQQSAQECGHTRTYTNINTHTLEIKGHFCHSQTKVCRQKLLLFFYFFEKIQEKCTNQKIDLDMTQTIQRSVQGKRI